MNGTWERHQTTRKHNDDERERVLLHELCIVQRVSESRVTASQIIIAVPGAWKSNTWRGVRQYLLSGEWC